MAKLSFKKATKRQSKLRMSLIGPSGSGKTFTSLRLATGLGGRIAVIDTERGSASKYSDQFDFDVLELESFAPRMYVDAIKAAEEAGYDVLIIDSLTHAWSGKGGALEMVDKAAKRSQAQNSYTAWRDVTPEHNAMVDAILQCKMHVFITMRVKTEYVLEENEKGKKVPRKIGLAPIQRDGLEYETDVVADMNLDHELIVSKTRCQALDKLVVREPGKELADTLKAWLTDGAPMAEPEAAKAPQEPLQANGATAPNPVYNVILEMLAAAKNGADIDAARKVANENAKHLSKQEKAMVRDHIATAGAEIQARVAAMQSPPDDDGGWVAGDEPAAEERPQP